MSYSGRYGDDSPRQMSSRVSVLSSQGGEESSFGSGNASNSHLNKTLSKLIDCFDISLDNESPQESQRKKERLLERYSNLLTKYVYIL